MCTGSLFASDWITIGEGVSYLSKSVIKKDQRISVWVKTQFARPQNQVSFILAHEVYVCDSKTYMTGDVRFMNEQNQIVYADNYKQKGYMPIVAHSISEAKYNFFCDLLKK